MASGGVRVEGADQLRDLGRDLRAAGHAALVKDMTRGLQQVAKDDILPATRHRALATLPKRGGLARLVAKAPQRITARAGATSATVAVVVPGRKKGSGASQADAGAVRHPTFGHRPFVSQSVQPGWHTKAAEAQEQAAQEQMLRVMDEVARRAGFL